MANKESQQYIFSKEETYRSLSILFFLNTRLSEKHRMIFLKSLKKNPIRRIIESDGIKPSQIYKNPFEEYFIYLPDEKDQELYFIKKVDINKVSENIKVSLINGWKTDKWYLLN